jgi:uncharacterized membrane protein YphA (DoxX/SURF4 family)
MTRHHAPSRQDNVGKGRSLALWLPFGARFFLGFIFFYASLDKILHPAAFAETVHNYQILPDVLINLTAVVLPWLEFLTGSLLILGLWMPGAVFTCNALLLIFFSTVLFNLARGLDIDCGCFTASSGLSSRGSMLWYLFRDGFFLLLGLYLFHITLRPLRNARVVMNGPQKDMFTLN